MARSIKKGHYVNPKLQKKVAKVVESGDKEVIKTWSRRSMITPDFVGLTIQIHNGSKFLPIFISENMVGHKLGEFATTRTFRKHSDKGKASEEASKIKK